MVGSPPQPGSGPEQVEDRVRIRARSESAVERCQALGEPHQQGTRRVEAVCVPRRVRRRISASRIDSQLVLQCDNLREVLRVSGIDQGADGHRDMRSREHRGFEPVLARCVEDVVDVVVLVDDHRGLIAAGRFRHPERGALADVEDRRAVERVAVHAHHCLFVDRGRLAGVMPAVHPARPGDEIVEVPVRFSPDEVDGVDALRRHGNLLPGLVLTQHSACAEECRVVPRTAGSKAIAAEAQSAGERPVVRQLLGLHHEHLGHDAGFPAARGSVPQRPAPVPRVASGSGAPRWPRKAEPQIYAGALAREGERRSAARRWSLTTAENGPGAKRTCGASERARVQTRVLTGAING